MKRLIFIVVLLYGTHSYADCFLRSSVKLSNQRIEFGPKDIQKLVVPDDAGKKCVLRYRLLVNDQWQTAEGVGYGPSDGEACARALDIRKGYLLEEVTSGRITADNQMVCSDLPEIRVHPVKIGDIVYESETDVHTIPVERKYFWYKRSRCRMFVERDSRDQNLMLYQGVVCAVSSHPDSKWRVIDKY